MKEIKLSEKDLAIIAEKAAKSHAVKMGYTLFKDEYQWLIEKEKAARESFTDKQIRGLSDILSGFDAVITDLSPACLQVTIQGDYLLSDILMVVEDYLNGDYYKISSLVNDSTLTDFEIFKPKVTR